MQRVDEVGFFCTSELVASDGLRRVGKGFFFTSDTHSRDYDFVEQLRVVLHYYIDFILSVDGAFDSLVTDVRKFQFVASCRHFDRVVTIDIGCRRYTGSRNLYGEADECFAGGIGNVTGYNFRVGTLSRCTCAGDISLRRCGFFRQHDVGVLYRVRNVGPFEHDIEYFADRLILNVKVYFAFRVHLGVDNKQTLSFFLDFFQNFVYRSICLG